MAAYAVIARIDRVMPRLAGGASASVTESPVVEAIELPEAIDLVGRPLLPLVTERWSGVREAWAQTTFYLFHAEGWR